jgi:drug/metabolite transporter (DMT)-like permease
MFFLLETMLAPLWVWLIFSERPSWAGVVGGTVVIVTLLAHSLWRLSTTLQNGKPRRSERAAAHP